MRTRVVLCAGIVLCLAGALGAQTSTTWMAPKRGQLSKPTNWAGEVMTSATIKAFFIHKVQAISKISPIR